MSISTARFENFTVFSDATFEFCPGINVLIGENGTGKSHVLKAAYTMIQAQSRIGQSHPPPSQPPQPLGIQSYLEGGKDLEGAFLKGVFLVSDRGRLRRREAGPQDGMSVIRFHFGSEAPIQIYYAFTAAGNQERLYADFRPGKAVFLPPREVLSMFPGFTVLWEKYDLRFDRTYFDLCEALEHPLLRQAPPIFRSILDSLEQSIGGRIELHGSEFVLKRDDGDLEISLMAEGHRKLATVLYLLLNESLVPGGYLFWDEPEANMNPRLVVLLKNLLLGLAQAGIQVFVATHDFLLTSELSMASRYEGQRERIRFFALSKTDSGVVVDTSDDVDGLQDNPIVAEFGAHYDREAYLFARKTGAVP